MDNLNLLKAQEEAAFAAYYRLATNPVGNWPERGERQNRAAAEAIESAWEKVENIRAQITAAN